MHKGMQYLGLRPVQWALKGPENLHPMQHRLQQRMPVIKGASDRRFSGEFYQRCDSDSTQRMSSSKKTTSIEELLVRGVPQISRDIFVAVSMGIVKYTKITNWL